LHIVILLKFALLFYNHERKHQQGDGKNDGKEGEFRFKTRKQLTCTRIRMKRKEERKNGSNYF
jgi:hypothetical protein